MIKRYVQPKADTQAGQRAKEAQGNTITQLNACPFISGQQLVVDLTIGNVRVYHKLGHVPKGCLHLSSTGLHDYYMKSTSTDTYAEFNSTIAIQVTVWLF